MKKSLFTIKHEKVVPIFLVLFFLLFNCSPGSKGESDTLEEATQPEEETITKQEVKEKALEAGDIRLVKEITYSNYSLEDEYPYQDTLRRFQWEKIKDRIAHIENEVNREVQHLSIGVFSNYRNGNGEAPTVENFVRNEYKRVSDQHGVERYQSVPLYRVDGDTILERYGRDGWIAKILDSDTAEMVRVKGISFEGEYLIPNRYLMSWGNAIQFTKVIAVDVTNQNITTLEKRGNQWYILSMNPATTGVHNPPYAHETPVGIFVIQEQKEKMYYTKDGSSELAGYAPYASRFTNGAYVHGVPVQYPRESIIEWSNSLGTIPRSHMCVRNASSHSKFVYDLATVKEAVVIVID